MNLIDLRQQFFGTGILIGNAACQDNTTPNVINPRTDGGGVYPPPPLRFFPDSVKTAARSVAKFGMTILTFIAHITRKY